MSLAFPPLASPQRYEDGLSNANLSFTALFCLEFLLKVVGLGPWTYMGDYWNIFDATVVAFRCTGRGHLTL
jgi:hypothetical protein